MTVHTFPGSHYFHVIHVPLSHDPPRGVGSGHERTYGLWLNLPRNRNEDAVNLKLWLEGTTSNVWFPRRGQPTGRWNSSLRWRTEALWDQHWTKIHAKPDVVALMPTSYDCEDDECVDGSAISPATVYVHVFRTSKKGTIVFEDEHPLELSVVHMYSYFRGHCSIIGTHGTRVSLILSCRLMSPCHMTTTWTLLADDVTT